MIDTGYRLFISLFFSFYEKLKNFSARVGGGTYWHNARWNVGIRGLMNY